MRKGSRICRRDVGSAGPEEKERLRGEARGSWELGSLSWSQLINMCVQPSPPTPPQSTGSQPLSLSKLNIKNPLTP